MGPELFTPASFNSSLLCKLATTILFHQIIMDSQDSCFSFQDDTIVQPYIIIPYMANQSTPTPLFSTSSSWSKIQAFTPFTGLAELHPTLSYNARHAIEMELTGAFWQEAGKWPSRWLAPSRRQIFSLRSVKNAVKPTAAKGTAGKVIKGPSSASKAGDQGASKKKHTQVIKARRTK